MNSVYANNDDYEKSYADHTKITDKINDMLIGFQDSAYELGLNSGMKEIAEVKNQLSELLYALESLVSVCSHHIDDFHVWPEGNQAINAINKARAGGV